MEFNIGIDNCINIQFKDMKITGGFSVDTDGEMRFDSSRMRYYIERDTDNICFDLNQNIKNFRPFNPDLHINSRRLNMILRWIQKHYKKIEANPEDNRWLQPNFIFHRVVLSTLLKTPFLPNETWTILAAKWKGSIYLRLVRTEQAIAYEISQSPIQKQCTAWGHVFAQCMTADTADGLPSIGEPVDANAKFFSIINSHLGDHSLLYSAVVHAVKSDKTWEDQIPYNELECIEFKTCRLLKTQHHHYKFERFTTLTMWSQCISSGAKKTVIGFRDADEGVIRELKTYSVTDLVDMGQGKWNASKSMNFANTFLTHIRENVLLDCDNAIYKFERFPRQWRIKMTEILPPFREYEILPKWYTENTM